MLLKTDETIFKVSISWPLESGDDESDSLWGTNAYEFKKAHYAMWIREDKFDNDVMKFLSKSNVILN